MEDKDNRTGEDAVSMVEIVEKSATGITQDEYFRISEDRETVTPENLAGLIEYPALFRAMSGNRELRPALSPAMSSGRAMNDFLTCTAEEFAERYTIEPGPTNPKTGKPFGSDTKAYLEWAAKLTKTPVTPEEHAMFGNMAKAYGGHKSISALYGMKCLQNFVIGAEIWGVKVMVKIDKLYFDSDVAVAVDIKTTSDLCAFERSAGSLMYREQQGLIALVLRENGFPPDRTRTVIAAIEKGPLPRCGVFAVKEIAAYRERVDEVLADYADSVESGVYKTGFEDIRGL